MEGKTISILGSTGSIGRQSLEVAEKHGYRVSAFAAGRNTGLLEAQARKFRPEIVSVYDEEAAKDLRVRLADTGIRVLSGEMGLIEAASSEKADTVITAVVGTVGLKPTMAAIKCGKRIALANKETLVCAGPLVMKAALEHGAEIIPVDSEHSAIFQCLLGKGENKIKRLLLTASGGPFRGKSRAETENASLAEALSHPNWSMGPKITIDSATMMNKGLEFIEAIHLFGVTPDMIKVLVHPQSIVHSMVEFEDNSVLAQMGLPDMRLPIQFALTYPERLPSPAETTDFTKIKELSFEEPDLEAFPCLGLAMDVAGRDDAAAAVMNAANEAAVGLFLQDRIKFGEIYSQVKEAVEILGGMSAHNIEDIFEADAEARRYMGSF